MNTPQAATSRVAARHEVSTEEHEVRVDLAACYRLIARYGWDDLIFTHISARVPGPVDHFLLNPYGMMFHEITASSLVKVDFEGNLMAPSDHIINPAGFTIHSAIHRGRPDVNCIIHLHTRDGAAVSAQSQGLLPLSQTAMAVFPMVAYHDYEGVARNLDERERLVRDLGNRSLMILRNHGTLACGPSVPEAFLFMYFLERACQIQVASLAGVRNPEIPLIAVQETVARQAREALIEERAAQRAWPALLRTLDAVDPSYRY